MDEANQKRSQKLDQQLAQVKEQRAQAEKYFRESSQQNSRRISRRISVARYGEEAVAEKDQFRDDVAKVGGDRAIVLSNQRKQAAEFENAMAEKKRKAEEEARAEREKIEAERRKFLDEQAAAQRKEAERLERIRQEQEAKERAEREERELAERLAQAAMIAAEEAASRERLKPQAEKMKDFADRITFLVIDAPTITEPELVGTMTMAIDGLQSITDALTAAATK